MRKTTLGISLVALLGFAGTAAADHYDHDGDCDHDNTGYDDDYYDDSAYYDNDDYYDDSAYYDNDDDYYGDEYDYTANGWITPTIALPVVKTVVVQPRAGYVWVEGRWSWTGYEWAWVDGYWLKTRSNSDWIQGSWQFRNGHQRWVDGRWKPRTRVVVTTNNNRWNTGHRWNKGHRWNNGHRGGRGTTKVVVRNHRRGRR